MQVRRAVVVRLTRLLVRWNLLGHPHGREYVREHYTLTGRLVGEGRTSPEGSESPTTAGQDRREASTPTRTPPRGETTDTGSFDD